MCCLVGLINIPETESVEIKGKVYHAHYACA
jgi:hypothetical protein